MANRFAPLLRSRLSDTNYRDEFDEPAGKLVAVKRPKEREPVGTSICLLQQLLEVEVDEDSCVKPTIRARDLARLAGGPSLQRTAEDRILNGSERQTISAPILLYIWWGIREILKSVAPLELRQA